MTDAPEIDLTSDADLAELLQHLLEVAGVSSREVERRGGPSHQTVGRMLRGERLEQARALLTAIEAAGYQVVIRSQLGPPALPPK